MPMARDVAGPSSKAEEPDADQSTPGRAEQSGGPAEEEPSRPVRVTSLAPPKPLRVEELAHGVRLSFFAEGDGETFPQQFVEADLVGRLPSGCVFESTRGKGQPPMRMELGAKRIIPGMELGLRAMSLGARAELRIPAALGYGDMGIPRMVPPGSDLTFEIHLVVVDGKKCDDTAKEPAAGAPGPADGKAGDDTAEEPVAAAPGPADGKAGAVAGAGALLTIPAWLARVERPPPTDYYTSFCRYMARDVPPHVLARARPIPRKTRAEVQGWDLTGGACIVTGAQDDWKARGQWSLDWFREKLGERRQLLKWQGPVFTTQESLWDCPVWETSLAEYIDYVHAVDSADSACAEDNASSCPRPYLNGWPVFTQLPWMREYVQNPTFFDDCSGELIAQSESMRESFIAAVTRGYAPPSDEERQQVINNEYWELTKLFISPKGALTRLHYDNGGAHAWLSQVQGRKLFVCYPPSDGEYLHAFVGDEGMKNGSWIDPLAEDVLEKWPDYAKATPYIAVVEEGETIVAPKGWWHYAVALDSSITVMRNFFSQATKEEFTRRKDDALTSAFATTVLKSHKQLKSQPDSVLMDIARKTVAKIRSEMAKPSGSAKLPGDGQAPAARPAPGGYPAA